MKDYVKTAAGSSEEIRGEEPVAGEDVSVCAQTDAAIYPVEAGLAFMLAATRAGSSSRCRVVTLAPSTRVAPTE